jgi:hypothetical protein
MIDEATAQHYLIDRAARIIDQFAFRERQPLIDRQRIARNKANLILAEVIAEREALVAELATAHRHIDQLLAKTPFDAVTSELRCAIKRRANLLARYERQPNEVRKSDGR